MAVTQIRALTSVLLVLLAVAGPARNCDASSLLPSTTGIATQAPMQGHCDGGADTGQTSPETCAVACANIAMAMPNENFVPFDDQGQVVTVRDTEGLFGMRGQPDPHPPRLVGLC